MCATDVIVPHMCIEEEGRNMRFPISSTQCNAYVSSDKLTWVKKFSAWTSNKSTGVSNYSDFCLCTRKWGNSALAESLLQPHFHVACFFPKTKMLVIWGIGVFVESQKYTVVQSYDGMMEGN